jgi:hypothetical protein
MLWGYLVKGLKLDTSGAVSGHVANSHDGVECRGHCYNHQVDLSMSHLK